jgi:hypothetical protein
MAGLICVGQRPVGVRMYSSNAREALVWEAHFRKKEMCVSRMGRLYPPPWRYDTTFSLLLQIGDL